MVTGLLDKLLTVGLETGADVGHDLHLYVHGEVQLPEYLLLPPHRGRPLLIVKLMLLGTGFESFDSSVVDPDHLNTLSSLTVNNPVIDFLDHLVPVGEARWGDPSSNPWFWRTGGHSERAKLWSIHYGAEGHVARRVVMPLVTVFLQLLLQLFHIVNNVLRLVLSTNVVDASNNNYFQPVGHMEVIPPQSSGHVLDPASNYGVHVVVHLAGRHLVPHPVQRAVSQHNSSGISGWDGDRLHVFTDRTHEGLLLVVLVIPLHPSDVTRGEVRVPDGLAHIRAHRAGYVPASVLSDLLGRSGSLCRVSHARVSGGVALAAGSGGGAWHA